MLGRVARRIPWLVPTPVNADSGSSLRPEAFHWNRFLPMRDKVTLFSLYRLVRLVGKVYASDTSRSLKLVASYVRVEEKSQITSP